MERVVIVTFEGVRSLDVAGPAAFFAGATEILESGGHRGARDPRGRGTGETMRRTLIRQIGVSPDAYRQRFTHQP